MYLHIYNWHISKNTSVVDQTESCHILPWLSMTPAGTPPRCCPERSARRAGSCSSGGLDKSLLSESQWMGFVGKIWAPETMVFTMTYSKYSHHPILWYSFGHIWRNSNGIHVPFDGGKSPLHQIHQASHVSSGWWFPQQILELWSQVLNHGHDMPRSWNSRQIRRRGFSYLKNFSNQLQCGAPRIAKLVISPHLTMVICLP